MKPTKKAKRDKLARLRDKIKEAEKEYQAFDWLIQHDIEIDNCIYYGHTDTFCFGWRSTLTDAEINQLKKALTEFPYKVEYK